MQNKASEDGTMMSFREISTYLRSHKDIVEGELYVGSDHIVALDSAPFFRLIPNNPRNVSFDAARLVLIRKGSCDITIGPMKFNCRPGDIVFINSGVVINDDEVDKNTKTRRLCRVKILIDKVFWRPPSRTTSCSGYVLLCASQQQRTSCFEADFPHTLFAFSTL